MQLLNRLGFFAGLLAFTALLAFPATTAAQGAVTWSEPINLSSSLTSSNHPAVVADAFGYVHVFWSEDMNGREVKPDELPDGGNTILYRRWDGKRWTDPLDILAIAGDPLAEFVSVAVDSSNQLHLVWTGLTKLYYSTAPAAEAYSVKAWSAPQVISPESARTQWEADVAVDSRNNVHVVYATKGAQTGVFHVMAAANSRAWSAPTRISGFLRENEVAFKDVRLVIDEQDRLHAVWSTANNNGFSQAVYYARSESGGEFWDEAVMLADATINNGFTGFPSLLAYEPDRLLLIHVDQGNKGRIERTSEDGGRTWSEPRFILTSMEGVNGFLIPLIDNGGNLHLVINARPSADQRTGIYYAPRAGLDWAPIVPVAVDAPYGPSAHYTDATVRLGNEIHVVWNQARGGEIWYVRGVINGAEPIPAQPTPSPLVQTTPAPTRPAATASAISTVFAPTPSTQGGQARTDLAASPPGSASTWTPLAAAVVPVLLLLSGVMLWQLRKR
jgi:hypothetical protein